MFLHQEHEDRQLSESVLLTKHQHDELRAVVDRVSPLIDSDPNVLLSSLTRTVKNRASETAFPEKNVLSGLEIDANGTNVQCKPPYKNVAILENVEQESDPFPPLPPKPCPPPLPPRDPGFPQSDTSSRYSMCKLYNFLPTNSAKLQCLYYNRQFLLHLQNCCWFYCKIVLVPLRTELMQFEDGRYSIVGLTSLDLSFPYWSFSLLSVLGVVCGKYVHAERSVGLPESMPNYQNSVTKAVDCALWTI